MKLKDFVNKFVCENTIIRLWCPVYGAYRMISISDNDPSLCMGSELLNGEAWQSKYNNCEVVGVRTMDTLYYNKGVVNIIIKLD